MHGKKLFGACKDAAEHVGCPLCHVLCGVGTDWLEDWDGALVNGGEHLLGVTMNHVRANLFEMIDTTPSLCWLMITSRPENFDRFWDRKKRKNVWLGARVRDQIDANHRLPYLHAAKRQGYVDRTFALFEQMQGQVTLNGKRARRSENHLRKGALDLVVITGGLPSQWSESLRIQCEGAGVPLVQREIPDASHMDEESEEAE